MPKCEGCGITVKRPKDFEGKVVCGRCSGEVDISGEALSNTSDVPTSKIETPSHYTQEGRPQTVDKQKAVGEILEGHLTGNEIHFILTALKYFDRAGEKIYDGMTKEESFKKDMEKTADYLYQLKHEEFLNQKK